MKEEDIKPVGDELHSLALRYGISEYVFIYSSDDLFGHVFGHVSGNLKGPTLVIRVLGLIEAIRIYVREELVNSIDLKKG